jgi:hypothetical protein
MTSFDVLDSSLLRCTQDDSSNYFEFILINKSSSSSSSSSTTKQVDGSDVDVKDSTDDRDMQSFDTSISKDAFYTLMYKMMDTNYKYNHKQYRELVIGDVQYHNYKNEEISVFSVSTDDVKAIDNKFCMLAHHKNKLSILSLPSSLKVYNDNVVRKMIFRISNRVFVNFEHGMTGEEKYYKVYVNYNHDSGVDVNNAIDIIKKTLVMLC